MENNNNQRTFFIGYPEGYDPNSLEVLEEIKKLERWHNVTDTIAAILDIVVPIISFGLAYIITMQILNQ